MDFKALMSLILNKVAEIRKQKNKTQADLAQSLYLSDDQYRAIEKGRSAITLERFLHLCSTLETCPATVLQSCTTLEKKAMPLQQEAPAGENEKVTGVQASENHAFTHLAEGTLPPALSNEDARLIAQIIALSIENQALRSRLVEQ
jgi:transcriptional regulator with XRE-family HTH domain